MFSIFLFIVKSYELVDKINFYGRVAYVVYMRLAHGEERMTTCRTDFRSLLNRDESE